MDEQPRLIDARRLWSLFTMLALMLLGSGFLFLQSYTPVNTAANDLSPTATDDGMAAIAADGTNTDTATASVAPTTDAFPDVGATLAVAPIAQTDVPEVAPDPPATVAPAAVASTTPVPTAVQADLICHTPGQFSTISIQSKVLGVKLPVDIYLPPCYDDTHYAYPTLYLIQGSGYVSGQWANDGVNDVAEEQVSRGQLAPFIIVMPANDAMSGNGSRFMYTSRGSGSWEDFIANELVPYIDRKYSTWQSRDGRAIGGISRGGYWSLEIAFTHTKLFSIVGGHSPAITNDFLYGTTAKFSMLDLASSIDSVRSLRIYLDAGLGDVTQNGVYQLASELGVNKIPYTGSIVPGVHDDKYWSARMGAYLAFYAAAWPITPRSR